MSIDNQLILDIIQRLGIAGVAMYFMYLLTSNHLKDIKEAILELKQEIKELKEILIKVLVKYAS
jgi:hypothetical protein